MAAARRYGHQRSSEKREPSHGDCLPEVGGDPSRLLAWWVGASPPDIRPQQLVGRCLSSCASTRPYSWLQSSPVNRRPGPRRRMAEARGTCGALSARLGLALRLLSRAKGGDTKGWRGPNLAPNCSRCNPHRSEFILPGKPLHRGLANPVPPPSAAIQVVAVIEIVSPGTTATAAPSGRSWRKQRKFCDRESTSPRWTCFRPRHAIRKESIKRSGMRSAKSHSVLRTEEFLAALRTGLGVFGPPRQQIRYKHRHFFIFSFHSACQLGLY